MAKHQLLSSEIYQGMQAAISQAIERHRKLGESIAIWRDGKVVILTADQIHQIQQQDQPSEADENLAH